MYEIGVSIGRKGGLKEQGVSKGGGLRGDVRNGKYKFFRRCILLTIIIS